MTEIAKVPLGMGLVLALAGILFLLILWNFHRDNNNSLDLKDLVCLDGKLNEAKFSRFVAFIVSTWGFVYLIIDQRFSEWYFAGYMTAWCGNALVNKYLNIKDQAQSHGTTATQPPVPPQPPIPAPPPPPPPPPPQIP